MLDILAQTDWTVHHGGLNNAYGGLIGKLTKCRWRSVIVYVRENVVIDHFLISSNERLGLKRGKSINYGQVLELCAAPEIWTAIAKEVRELDSLHRHVRPNRLFTLAWARRQFSSARGPAQGLLN